MISRSSGEKVCGFQAKEEEEKSSNRQIPKVAQSSSRRWSLEFRNNPRVVRVSRTFGGKDRHSKVFTVRGLRDRRIRLSVATAVQLYDLQDKLGLGQPSKVIDWLMDVTKHDIDQLPPLQIPHALTRFNQHMLFSPEMFMTSSETCYLSPKLKHQNVTAGLIQKSHELERQCFFSEKGKQIEESNGEKLNCTYPGNARPILARNLLPSTCWLNHYSLQHDPPSGHHPQYSQYNLSLSPFGSNGPSMSQRVNTYNTNDDAGFFPSSSISLAPETQFIFCNPSAVNVPPLVPSCSPCWPSSSTTPVVEDETRQMSHFQFFSGSGSQLPFPSFSTPASPKNPIGSLMRPTPTNLALLLSQDQSRAD